MKRDLSVVDEYGYSVRQECPSCATSVSSARVVVKSEPCAELLPPEQHGKFLSGYDSRRIFFSYARCSACQLLYCPTYYSPGHLERLYGHQSENMAELPLTARSRTQAAYADLIEPQAIPDGDYLELGADIGLCASTCSKRKRFRHYWLYEPNREVHGELGQQLSHVPHTIKTEAFSVDHVPPDSIALAVCIHVLDHVWEPVAMLRALHDVMRRGARILVVTHDERSLLARILGKRWPPYTLQHPQLFSATSLERIAREAGFDVTRVVKTVNFFPVFFLVDAGLRVLGTHARFRGLWQSAQIGLRLGNVAVIAQKR